LSAQRFADLDDTRNRPFWTCLNYSVDNLHTHSPGDD
jgi:hypothetical protein